MIHDDSNSLLLCADLVNTQALLFRSGEKYNDDSFRLASCNGRCSDLVVIAQVLQQRHAKTDLLTSLACLISLKAFPARPVL
ncbi:MAG TPA: hypothetical protein VK141_06425 [Nitrosomonas sp.]|nr:hypothetical protein [Nitrosomonas sp.]